MTPTPVGMRCPECSRQKTKVRTAATIRRDPQLTYVLIAINVIAFLAMSAGGGGFDGRGGTVYDNGALFGPLVADGEWWRIVTSGLPARRASCTSPSTCTSCTSSGRCWSPRSASCASPRSTSSRCWAARSARCCISPDAVTVGASGAVFGLMGAAILAMRARGIDPMQSGLGVTLLLNLGITFLIPNISIGGHIGGLVAGGIVGYFMFEVAERRRIAMTPVLGVCVALGGGAGGRLRGGRRRAPRRLTCAPALASTRPAG